MKKFIWLVYFLGFCALAQEQKNDSPGTVEKNPSLKGETAKITPYGDVDEGELLHSRPWGNKGSRSVAQEDGEGDEVEKISVTGSHIKRTDTEGASPLLVIDREEIEQSGYSSLSDILRDMTVAVLGGPREASLQFPSSASGTTIRGSSDILVLMNGQRMAPVGGTRSVDLSMIPVSVIERVEVLKDGGSSLYGSDAVGGVLNVITKKNYSGIQINVRGSLVQRKEGNKASSFASFFDFSNWDGEDKEHAWSGKGDQFGIDAHYGGGVGEWSYMAAAQLGVNNDIYMRDRSFGNPTAEQFGKKDAKAKIEHWSPKGSPGRWKDSKTNKWQADPSCPQERIFVEKDGSSSCKFNYADFMQFTPKILRGGAFFQAERDWENTSLFTTLMYLYSKSFSVLAPAPDTFGEGISGADDFRAVDKRIPMATAHNLGLTDAQGDVTLDYRLVDEKGAGPRKGTLNSHAYQFQTRATRFLGETLEWNTDFNLSGSHYLRFGSNYANMETLLNMLNKGEFNPFAPKDKKSDISKAMYNPESATHALLISLDPRLTGELGEIAPGWPVYFATGLFGAWQDYKKSGDAVSIDRKQWGGGVASKGGGSYFFSGLYGELAAPFSNILEAQISARTDFYSNFGFTRHKMDLFGEKLPLPFSPGIRLTYEPVDGLKFRTSWNMGFKAPTLEDMYNDEVVNYPFGQDQVLCDTKNQCKTEQHKTIEKPNEELKPETFQALNVGVIVSPVREFSLTLDYFKTHRKDFLGMPDIQDIFNYEAKEGSEALKKYGQEVYRKDGEVNQIVRRPYNLGYVKRSGLDFEADFILTNTGIPWDMVFGMGHIYMLHMEEQVFTGGDISVIIPYHSRIEKLFGIKNQDPYRKQQDSDDAKEKKKTHLTRATWPGSPRWKNTARIGILSKSKKYGFYLMAHSIPGQLKQRPSNLYNKIQKEEIEGYERLDDYWQIDVKAIMNFNKKNSLVVGIKNIFDNKRPFNDKDSQYINPSLYSILGRTVDIRYTYSF